MLSNINFNRAKSAKALPVFLRFTADRSRVTIETMSCRSLFVLLSHLYCLFYSVALSREKPWVIHTNAPRLRHTTWLQCLVIQRLLSTFMQVFFQGSLRLEVVPAAHLTARLRPNAVVRSQVEQEILLLLRVIDLATVWTHHLK